MSRRSLRLLAELPREVRERAQFARQGSLLLVAGEEDEPLARAQAEMLAAAGVDVDWLVGERVRALEPALGPEVRAALYCTEDAQVTPEPLRDHWLDVTRAGGGRLVEAARVTRLLRRGDRVRGVLTAGGSRYWAENVVLAAGAWSSRLARGVGLDLVVRPRAGLLLRGYSESRLAIRPLVGAEYLRAKFGAERCSVAFTFMQRADGVWLLGGTREFEGFSVSAGPEVVERVRRQALRYLPALGGIPGGAVLTGFRPWCGDGSPRVGRSVPGLLLACGHEGDGVMLAAATAERVADDLESEPAPVSTP